MKEVHVRRHAPKAAEGHLTEEGREKARLLQRQLGTFDLVIASNIPRAQETAVLLTGMVPVTDTRATPPALTAEQERQLNILGESHPYGIAGVIFDSPEFREMIMRKGKVLAELIQETIEKLQDNQKALLISHDGMMVAAEKILKHDKKEKAEKTYHPLEGYAVDDQLQIRNLKA
jgi:broad specificity phosphatase PhoE